MENDEFILPGETNKEVGLATLKTIESLKGVCLVKSISSCTFFILHRRKVLLKHLIFGGKKNQNLLNMKQHKKH